MAEEKDSKKNKPISINDLSIQDLENLAKKITENRNSTLFGLNQSREDAEYTKEEVRQMRVGNDKRLYKSPAEVTSSYGCVWENGKVGYFIPFNHRSMGMDFLQPKFGGSQSDGKGLRFVQNHKDETKTYFSFAQKNDIILSGFGEYVLGHWGKDLNDLYVEYTNLKYRQLAEKWKKEHFPTKIDQLVKLNLLKELKSIELAKWNEATIAGFFTTADNDKLNQCMTGYFSWFDKCLLIENNKGEIEYVKNIKSGTLTCGNGWANGKSGQFKDFENDYQLRFCETDENGYHYLQNEEEQKISQVLACGFVAWLIKHWGEDTQTIYSGYLQAQVNQYKSAHKNDPDVFKRDLEGEFFNQYKSKEDSWIEHSEAIFEFISEDEVLKIKKYIDNYIEFVSQHLPYKVYNTFDEAIREINIQDKILLHTISKFTSVTHRSPLNIFNDILMIRYLHLKEPSRCMTFIKKNYIATSNEYFTLIHILKNTLDRNCDLQLLLPDISAKKDLTDEFDNLQNSNRKKLTVHFDIYRGVVLRDETDPTKLYTTINITDEIALHFLSTQPETRKHFYLLPPNVNELIEEYKSKLSENNHLTPLKTKEKKSANKNCSIKESNNDFPNFLLTKDQVKINSIVEAIKSDLKVSKAPNLSVALFTVALQKKNYLSTGINKTLYHKAFVGLFGKEAGTRAKFNEKYNEQVLHNLYERELSGYINLLP